MAENMTLSEIREALQGSDFNRQNSFSILKSITWHLNQNNDSEVQEIVLRVLEQRQVFENYRPLVNDFARQIGLFPYLDIEELNLADKIAYQFHKPDGFFQNSLVFHRIQAKVYFELLDGKNVILSAPTSFGKSLIIDSIITTEKFNNIAIVLPTIALIDETRKRLSKYKDKYKIITHSGQTLAKKNIFVLTQERVMEIVNDLDIDFFVIDEFYKLQISLQDPDRSIILNQAFYKLLKKGGQFYLLGPNIESINSSLFPKNVTVNFIKSDYKTVITEKIFLNVTHDDEGALTRLCAELTESTLIYCRSPKSANHVAMSLINSKLFLKTEINKNAVSWLKNEYHPLWYLPNALEYGIGIHHGKIPRAISQFSVKAFNDKKIQFLVCTSTLIEGVNTTAKNVIVFDNKIASDKFDFFTFNNICGRSGRMFQHFIGRVFLFHPPPTEELPVVDFPVFSQSEDVPQKLLIQIGEKDLTEQSKQRIKPILENEFLSVKTIKENSNIDPQIQINLAKLINENLKKFYPFLSWTRFPTYDKLEFCCELIWDYFVNSNFLHGISSGKQLAFKINVLRTVKSVKALIVSEVSKDGNPEKINEEIEETLDFIRYWAQFHFPNYLKALNLIQRELYSKTKMVPGNYSFFAGQVECLFTRPLFIALDEYGIPIQTCNKLKDRLNAEDNLDALLLQVKALAVKNLQITEFEKELIEDTQLHL